MGVERRIPDSGWSFGMGLGRRIPDSGRSFGMGLGRRILDSGWSFGMGFERRITDSGRSFGMGFESRTNRFRCEIVSLKRLLQIFVHDIERWTWTLNRILYTKCRTHGRVRCVALRRLEWSRYSCICRHGLSCGDERRRAFLCVWWTGRNKIFVDLWALVILKSMFCYHCDKW